MTLSGIGDSGPSTAAYEKEKHMTMADIVETTGGPEQDRPLYRAAGVTRTYTQKGRIVKALTGVDLQILPGEFVTIQGPTGGGKSTLLQLLGALDTPPPVRSCSTVESCPRRRRRSSLASVPRRSASSSRGST